MKTPMQEMLEWVRVTLPMDLETPRLIERKIESMLEKEKELFKQSFYNGFNCCCGKDFDEETEHLIKNNTSKI